MTQKFLKTVRASQSTNEFLIYDLAESIGLDKNELLEGKSLQLSVQADIAAIQPTTQSALSLGKQGIGSRG